MGQGQQTPGPLEMYGNLMGLKANQQRMDQSAQEHEMRMAGGIQEMQARQSQQVAAQRKQQYEGTVNALMSDAMTEDASGVSTFDRQKFQQGMTAQGLGAQYVSMSETLDKWDASALALQKQRNTLFAQTILGIHEHGDTPEGVLSAVAYLKKARLISDEESGTLIDGVSQDPSPEAIGRLLDGVAAHIPEYRSLVQAESERKTKGQHVLGENSLLVGPTGEVIARGNPKEIAPKESRPGEGQHVLSEGAVLVGPDGQVVARGNPKVEKPEKPEKVVREWVMRAGRPVRVSESEIQPGDEPYGRNAGLGTKNVTSGDAGRLAEFDTSLDDLRVLRQSLTSKDAAAQTGFAAKLGAGLWNPITEYTGIGAEAKAKQATIDRVKQVIGKALEGGVLRKEDEIKYEKILPTIGDPVSVVRAKLEGLDKAIAQRRERLLENLESAGYDTTKFHNKGAAPAARPSGSVRPGSGMDPSLQGSYSDYQREYQQRTGK